MAIAEDDPVISAFLREKLKRAGYSILGEVTNGVDAVQLVRVSRPQLLLMDWHMPLMEGIEALRQIVPLDTTAVVMMTGDTNPNLARQAMAAGVCGYLLKPFDNFQIVPMMESAWHKFHLVRSLQKEKLELQDALAIRKIMDQAKGILMEQQGYTEEQAHRMLQKMSQDQGIPIKDVCRSLIQVKLVLGRNGARAAKTLPKS